MICRERNLGTSGKNAHWVALTASLPPLGHETDPAQYKDNAANGSTQLLCVQTMLPARAISERNTHKLYNFRGVTIMMQTVDFPQGLDNPDEPDASVLDRLLNSKSKISRTKLEVLASEIHARLTMWDRNLSRINGDRDNVDQLLNQTTRLARYHLRDQQDVSRLQESALRLESHRRDEDIQCWRDIVLVMRDFLVAWEAHEQAKSRAIFINHAGSGTQEYL